MKPNYLELLKKANQVEGREELTVLLEIKNLLQKNNELLENLINSNEIEIIQEDDNVAGKTI